MQHVISGTTMPVLQIRLDPGEKIIAEPAEFSWMTDNIELRTTTQTAGARGLFGAIGRALSGGGLFMTEYMAVGAPAWWRSPPRCRAAFTSSTSRPATLT
jgi:uncharacterized protein (AIM24 family)